MSIEIKIKQLLEDHEHTDLVADELVKLWTSDMIGEDELESVAAFFYQCGYYPTLIDLSIRNLENSRPVPWKYFAESLKILLDDLDFSVVDAIHQEAEAQGRIEDLAQSKVLQQQEPSLATVRNEYFNRKWNEYRQQKITIDEQLQFLRTQRMLEQERELLQRYQKLFPYDESVKEAINSFEERWAREIVSKSDERSAMPRWINEIKEDPEVVKARDIVAQSAMQIARNTPELATDLAMMMFFMEGYQEALDTLNFAPDNKNKHWLQVELLLYARRYIEALDLLAQLEYRLASDPEATFACSYYRAMALHGAGQKTKAIDVMKALVQMKPNYRSASYMLEEWTGAQL